MIPGSTLTSPILGPARFLAHQANFGRTGRGLRHCPASRGAKCSTCRLCNLTSSVRLESSRFHAVAAEFHIAPSPGMVFACIQKQPSALGIVASSDAADGIRHHQCRRDQGERPNRKRGAALCRPLPFDVRGSLPIKLLPGICRFKISLQCCARRSGGHSPIQTGVKDFRYCFA